MQILAELTTALQRHVDSEATLKLICTIAFGSPGANEINYKQAIPKIVDEVILLADQRGEIKQLIAAAYSRTQVKKFNELKTKYEQEEILTHRPGPEISEDQPSESTAVDFKTLNPGRKIGRTLAIEVTADNEVIAVASNAPGVKQPVGSNCQPDSRKLAFGRIHQDTIVYLQGQMLEATHETKADLSEFNLICGLLFEALFVGDVRTLFYDQLHQAKNDGNRLHVELLFDSNNENRDLPWELIRDYDEKTIPASDESLVFSRCTRHGKSHLPRTPFRNPGDHNKYLSVLLTVPVEERQMPTGMESERVVQLSNSIYLKLKGKQVIVRKPERFDKRSLSEACNRYKPDILHMIARGNGGEEVMLSEDSRPNKIGVPRTAEIGIAFGEIFQNIEGMHLPKMLVLQVFDHDDVNEKMGSRLDKLRTFIGAISTSLSDSIPIIVAMTSDNPERVDRFNKYFYERVGDGRSIDAAVQYARKKLVDTPLEQCIFIMNSSDAIVFKEPASTTVKQPASTRDPERSEIEAAPSRTPTQVKPSSPIDRIQ